MSHWFNFINITNRATLSWQSLVHCLQWHRSNDIFTSLFPNTSLKSVQHSKVWQLFPVQLVWMHLRQLFTSSAVLGAALSTTLLALIPKSQPFTCCELSHSASPAGAAALLNASYPRWNSNSSWGQEGRAALLGTCISFANRKMNFTHHLPHEILIKAKTARGDRFIKTRHSFGSRVTNALPYETVCNFMRWDSSHSDGTEALWAG